MTIPHMICAGTLCAWITMLPKFDVVKSQRFAMPEEKELLLQTQCEALNKNGNLKDLFARLDDNTKRLLDMNVDELSQNVESLDNLRAEITSDAEKIKNILSPVWSKEMWRMDAEWSLKFTDVVDYDPKITNANFTFKNFYIDSIYLAGEKRDDLLPLVKLFVKDTELTVQLYKGASSLELCQMVSTLEVRGRVEYQFQGRSKIRSSNLTLLKGAKYTEDQKFIHDALNRVTEYQNYLRDNPIVNTRICDLLHDKECLLKEKWPIFSQEPFLNSITNENNQLSQQSDL